MGSTIYYKGSLKDNAALEELFGVIRLQMTAVHCRVVEEDESLYVEFLDGTSEPLLFRFKNRKVAGFCKWSNPENVDEYFRVFDMLIAIKPFFKSLRVDDDSGAWHEYVIRAKPCKIRLRGLDGPTENRMLERSLNGEDYDFSPLMLPGMRFLPYSRAVYCIIAQDFLKILQTDSIPDIDKHRVIELANKLQIAEYGQFTPENFTFKFPYMLLLIWIGYCLTYMDKGRVHTLSNDMRGLKTNKLAAQFGILSIFLNIHSGFVNSKHAEMKRFADDYINTDRFGGRFDEQAGAELLRAVNDYIERNGIDMKTTEPVFIPMAGEFKEACDAIFTDIGEFPGLKPDHARQSLEVLVSILDYLGFTYVGVEKSDSDVADI